MTGLPAPTPLTAWQPSPTTDPLGYPGRIPGYSFVMEGGHVHPVPMDPAVINGALASGAWLEDRTAVLAVGSNAAPARLEEKAEGRPVVALRVAVPDHSVVYSAHIARYGSIAATLHPDPGAITNVHVTCLDERQLAAVDRSEGNYGRVAMAESAVSGLTDVPASDVFRYESRWGVWKVDGRPVRLAEVNSSGSPLPSMSQLEVQTHVGASLTSDVDLARSGATTAAEVLRRGLRTHDEITRLLRAD